MNLYRSSICTCFFLFVVVVQCRLVFHSPEDVAGISLRSNQFMFVGDTHKLNITGRLILANPSHGCSWNDIKNKDDFEGNIVLIKRDDCSPADKFRTAQKGKASAVIIYADPSRYYLLAASNYLDSKGITIPGVEVRADTNDEYDVILSTLKNSSNYVNVTVVGDDADIHFGYFIAFSVVMGTWAVVNIALAAWKLQGFIKKEGKFTFSLPQMCLAIELLANALRVVLCLEPDLGIGRGIIEFGTVGFLQSGNLPWSFIATLMIAFYWDHSLKTFGKRRESLNVFSIAAWKIPLIILSIFLVLLDLASGTIRAMYYGTVLVAALILIVIAICVFAIAVFFTVNGIKVLRWANQTNSISKNNKTMSRMTKFVIINAAGLYGIVLGLIIAANTENRTTWYIGYWIVVMFVNFVSAMQILIFQPNDALSSSATSSGGEKTKSLKTTDSPTSIALVETSNGSQSV